MPETPFMPILDPAAWLGALAVFAAAYLPGSLACLRLRLDSAVDAALLRFTVGLALLPLLVLLAGRLQDLLMLRVLWIALAATGAALFAFDLLRGLRDRKPGTLTGREDALTRLAALPWVAWMFYLLAPLSCPPLNYDVLEYHLGVVPHFFGIGRIEPIPHVFYSAQPIATELLYTLASVVEGTPWGGASGRTQWGLVLLAGLLLWRAAERAGLPRTVAFLLPFGFLTHPIIVRLELDRMTDLTGGLFVLGGWLIWSHLMDGQPGPRRLAHAVALLGLLAGGAVSSKWTNAGTAALAIGMGPAVGLISAVGGEDGVGGGARGAARTWLACASLFLAALALVVIPWSAWVWAETGNPIAPFGAALFPTERWGPENLNYLLETHRPLSMLGVDYWERLAKRIVSPSIGLWPFFAAVGIALASRLRIPSALHNAHFVISRNAPRNVLLSGFIAVALGLLLWGRLRHSAERFLAPLIAMEFLMLGAAITLLIEHEAARWRRAAWTLLFATFIGAAFLSPVPPLAGAPIYLDRALGETTEADFLRSGLGATTDFFDAANALPEGSRLMAIGEARRFYFRHPVTLSSVFDRHPLAGFVEAAADPAALRRSLREAGYTHLAVNEYETARLLDFHPPPVLETDPAFMEVRAVRNYGELVRRYPGFSEFGAKPLTPPQRENYLRFLSSLRTGATYVSGGGPGQPAFWIAPL